jgi:hypothetical protein
MRIPASLAIAVLALAAAAPAAHAQGQSGPRLGVEVTGALVFPLGDASDSFDSGTQLGANLLVGVVPAVEVYGGYSYTQLPFSGEDVDADADLTLQGFEGGVRLSPGLALGPVRPTIVLGATYLEPKVSGGRFDDDDEEFERKLGYRAGLAFDIPLGQLVTASLGGSLVSHPFGDWPQCPPSKPNCLADNTFQLSAGLRVYPPILGGGR